MRRDDMDNTVSVMKEWLLATKPVRYTGRTEGVNKLAKPLMLFRKCVADRPAFWYLEHGYTAAKNRQPGSKASVYPLFRQALLCALREMRAAQDGVPVDEVPVVQYAFKSRETLTGGDPAPRGLLGFEAVKRGRPKGKKTAQPIARVNPRPGPHRARPVTQGVH